MTEESGERLAKVRRKKFVLREAACVRKKWTVYSGFI